MPSTPVRADQFEISQSGVTHKPTGASFTPFPGEPTSGYLNDGGHLGNVLPNGDVYRPNEVRAMMMQLWAEYVAKNPGLFPKAN